MEISGERQYNRDAMSLKTYLRFTRPFTLLPPLLGILSGAVCAFGSVHNPDPDRRITLSVAKAPVRELLAYLASKANLNLIVHDGVRGNVTLYLVDVPLETIIRSICRMNGLTLLKGPHRIWTVLPSSIHLRQLSLRLALERLRRGMPPVKKSSD